MVEMWVQCESRVQKVALHRPEILQWSCSSSLSACSWASCRVASLDMTSLSAFISCSPDDHDQLCCSLSSMIEAEDGWRPSIWMMMTRPLRHDRNIKQDLEELKPCYKKQMKVKRTLPTHISM